MSRFTDLIEGFVSSPTDGTMAPLVVMAASERLDDEEIALLAIRMAESGTQLGCQEIGRTADIASTGGPTSLTTVICPLVLRTLGYLIPKLGVPGRPAGAIDALAQVPGYRYEFEPKEIMTILSDSGYVHFVSAGSYAPLDTMLFQFRKRKNALDIPSLAIASILSKKIAVGVTLVGLDVRVAPHGNFGPGLEEAREQASRFCRIAKFVGCTPVCFLTSNIVPYQPYVGRGETLAALVDLLSGSPNEKLAEHTELCFRMSTKLASIGGDRVDDRGQLYRFAEIKEQMEVNLSAQGTSFAALVDYADSIVSKHVYHVTSQCEGFLFVDIGRLRQLIVDRQSDSRKSGSDFQDECGVILKSFSGEFVPAGEILATIRDSGAGGIHEFDSAFIIGERPSIESYFEVVSNG